MPLPLFAMMAAQAAPGMASGLHGLLKKRKKFEGTARGRMLGRRAGEGMFSSQEERTAMNRLWENLIRTAGEETEEIKRAAFPILQKSKLAGARLLSAPYRDVRGRMTEAELRLQAGERRAAKEAGQQFGMEEEQFGAREDAGRKASLQQLIGAGTQLATSGMQYLGARKMGLLKEGAPYKDYVSMQLLGMRPPAYFRPKEGKRMAPPGNLAELSPSERRDWQQSLGMDDEEFGNFLLEQMPDADGTGPISSGVNFSLSEQPPQMQSWPGWKRGRPRANIEGTETLYPQYSPEYFRRWGR